MTSAATTTDWNAYRKPGGLSVSDRNKIAAENHKLALMVAHRLAAQCTEPVEDLGQIGQIGLLKAVERFDPDEGVAFSSFAVPYIEGEIRHFLRDHWGAVKIPRRNFEKMGSLRKKQRKLKKLGRIVELGKIAEAEGISAEHWRWLQESVSRKPLVNIDDLIHVAAATPDDGEVRDYERLKASLIKAIARLPRLERECVTEHYIEQRSIAAIARRQKKSVLEVKEVVQRALSNLKSTLEAL